MEKSPLSSHLLKHLHFLAMCHAFYLKVGIGMVAPKNYALTVSPEICPTKMSIETEEKLELHFQRQPLLWQLLPSILLKVVVINTMLIGMDK